MKIFGQLKIFGMPFGMPSGSGAPPPFTTQMAALNWLVWLNMAETSGVIADNAAFTGAPGAELNTGNASSDAAGEVDATTNWSTNNATLVSQGTVVHTGARAFLITGTGAGARGALIPTVTRGRTYSISEAARTGAGGGQSLSTTALNPNQAQAITASYAVYTHRGIATTTTFQLRMVAGGAAGEIYGDAVSVTETGQRDGYITGTVTINQAGPATGIASYDFAAGNVEIVGTTIDGLTDAEILMLINPDSFAANRRILFKNGEWDVVVDAAGIVTVTKFYSGDDAIAVADTALTGGAWQWLRIQLNATTDQIRLWIDADEVTSSQQTGVGTPATNTNAWLLGSDATNHFDGKISQPAIGSALLSDAQYSNLLNAPDFA